MIKQQIISDIITTRKTRKIRLISEQSVKDHEELQTRMDMNGVKIDLVAAILEHMYGGRFTVEELLCLARKISKKINLKIDRLAHRNRSGLLCWFAENWNLIYPKLQTLSNFNTAIFSQVYQEEELKTNYNPIDPSDICQLLNNH